MTKRRCVSIGLAAAGGVWLGINKSVGEGRTLIWISTGHGLTTADVLSLAAFAAAGLLWVPATDGRHAARDFATNKR